MLWMLMDVDYPSNPLCFGFFFFCTSKRNMIIWWWKPDRVSLTTFILWLFLLCLYARVLLMIVSFYMHRDPSQVPFACVSSFFEHLAFFRNNMAIRVVANPTGFLCLASLPFLFTCIWAHCERICPRDLWGPRPSHPLASFPSFCLLVAWLVECSIHS